MGIITNNKQIYSTTQPPPPPTNLSLIPTQYSNFYPQQDMSYNHQVIDVKKIKNLSQTANKKERKVKSQGVAVWRQTHCTLTRTDRTPTYVFTW